MVVSCSPPVKGREHSLVGHCLCRIVGCLLVLFMYHVASQIAYIVSAKAMISLIPVMEIAWAADMNEDRQKVSWRHFGCDIDVRHVGKQLPFHWSNSNPGE